MNKNNAHAYRHAAASKFTFAKTNTVFMIINIQAQYTPEFAYRLAVVRGLNSHGGLYF